MKKYILLSAVLLITVCLNAIDNGLILDQYAKVSGEREQDNVFNYQASLIPRVSVMGENAELFVSSIFSVGYDESFYFILEALRTEFSMFFNNAKLSAGRMEYTAPFEYLAASLFDGVRFTYNTTGGAFSAGAWYTGYLYKRNANIIMTGEDYASYVESVNLKEITETYFASRRIVGALSWEHPAVLGMLRIKADVIAQIDINVREDRINSQYFTMKARLPAGSFLFEAGGAFQLSQLKKNQGSIGTGVAAEAGVSWTPPSSFPSRLSLNGLFSSGERDTPYIRKSRSNSSSRKTITSYTGMGAFSPINAKVFGEVIQIMHSGFSAVSLDYTARFHKTFSLNFNSSLIFPSLFGTYTNYIYGTAQDKEYFLGSEFYSSLVWSPASDIQLKLGGGIGLFSPEMEEARWHVKLSMIRALY